MIRTVKALRYVTPLREGGSLPAIVEADDDGTYVLKFRGAGQGQRALIAELVAGEIGRALGLPVPEIVFVELDPVLGRSEPDAEIKELIEASPGRNLGLDYLPGSLDYSPLLAPPPDPELAARIVWFDAYTTNVDRTARNTNMLLWHKRLYLIDHGASLTFHHAWTSPTRPYDPGDHVLAGCHADVEAADAALAPRVDEDLIGAALDVVPDDFWTDPDDPAESRHRYVEALLERLDIRADWLAALRRTVAEGGRERVLPKFRLRGMLFGGSS